MMMKAGNSHIQDGRIGKLKCFNALKQLINYQKSCCLSFWWTDFISALAHAWVLYMRQSLLLTPLCEELSSVSVDEVHNLYDHSVDNTGDEQQYSCPECGVLIVDRQCPSLHLKVDHHDIEGQVEAEQDEGQGHKVDTQVSLGVGVERLRAARHRVEPEDTVETRPRFFKGLLPTQCAPAVGQRGTATLPQLVEERFSWLVTQLSLNSYFYFVFIYVYSFELQYAILVWFIWLHYHFIHFLEFFQ